MSELTPREIVSELDRHIIGQTEAKRAVAIAMRNRWRRMQLDPKIRQEIFPKNILMIGPTGVGKTEIARRLATLAKAPFIKVEATKYTEVGYVGKEVDSIIRELMEVAVKLVKDEAFKRNKQLAEEAAEERILDALLPAPSASPDEKQSNHRSTFASPRSPKALTSLAAAPRWRTSATKSNHSLTPSRKAVRSRAR